MGFLLTSSSSSSSLLLLLLLLLLLMTTATIEAFHCPILECSCFYNGRETVKIACPPEHNGVQYTITHHVVQGQLTIECLEQNITYHRAMFASFQFTNIINIRFVRCPLPVSTDTDNITFAEIVQGIRPLLALNFNQLNEDHNQYEIKDGGDHHRRSAILDASLFNNLTGLEILDLDDNAFVDIQVKNQQSTIDENRFDYWPETLESLSLANNRLTKMPRSLLRLVPALHGLSLAGNRLRFVSEDDFDLVRTDFIQNLKLDRNLIETLGVGILKKMHQLKLLRLNDNRLHLLPNQLLDGLTHLQFLDLSQNDLERIPHQLLKDNIHLKTLKISNNQKLNEIADDFLSSATSLEELHLSGNNLTSVPPFLLENCNRLIKLNLRKNSLISIPATFLTNVTRLVNLDISGNKVTSLPEMLFKALVNLMHLNLSNNCIKSIDEHVLESNVKLINIDLSNNQLEIIQIDTFQTLINLKSIDLSFNFLLFPQSIQSPFIVPNDVMMLNVSNNMMTNIDLEWITYNNRLIDFNATYNQIKHVRINSLRHAITVDLRHNLVNTIELFERPFVIDDDDDDDIENATQKSPEVLVNIYLADNPISCDCHLLSFVNHVTSSLTNQSKSQIKMADSDQLVCTTPHQLLNRLLTTIKPEELYCHVSNSNTCDPRCTCTRLAVDDSVIVDCRHRQMTSLPSIIPSNTRVLHVEGNNITSLATLDQLQWSNLSELYASDNWLIQMDDIEPTLMPSHLMVIYLDNNKLKYLPEWFFQIIDNGNGTGTRRLRLGNNPWVCDCRNRAFQLWLATRGHQNLVIDYSDVICKVHKMERRVAVYVYGHLNRMSLDDCRSLNDRNDKTSVILAAVITLFVISALILGSKLILKNYFKIKLFILKLVIKRPTRKAISAQTITCT